MSSTSVAIEAADRPFHDAPTLIPRWCASFIYTPIFVAAIFTFASGCITISGRISAFKTESGHQLAPESLREVLDQRTSATPVGDSEAAGGYSSVTASEELPTPSSELSLPPLPGDSGKTVSPDLVQVAQTVEAEGLPAPPASFPSEADTTPTTTGTIPSERRLQLPNQVLSAAARPSTAPAPGRLFRSNSVDSVFGNASSILRNRLLESEQSDEDAEFDFPDVHSDPAKRYQEEYGVEPEYDPFIAPSLMNLIFEDRWLLAEKDGAKAIKNQYQRRMKIDIRDPDPDTANFPNGAYTLPMGRMYIETSPLGLYQATPNGNQARLYQWEYLIRYGMTDNLEFRIFSNGLSVQGPEGTQSEVVGYQPLAFDFKANFWEENTRYHIPAMGIEVYLQTQLFGSSAFNAGTQPSINLLFDQSLPFDIGFEYNFGYTGVQDGLGDIAYQFSAQWSFQREVVKDVDVFFHGFYNAAALPRFNQFQNASVGAIPKVTVVGVGGIWTVNNRLATFGSYNFGLTEDSPASFALLGFAYAL